MFYCFLIIYILIYQNHAVLSAIAISHHYFSITSHFPVLTADSMSCNKIFQQMSLFDRSRNFSGGYLVIASFTLLAQTRNKSKIKEDIYNIGTIADVG